MYSFCYSKKRYESIKATEYVIQNIDNARIFIEQKIIIGHREICSSGFEITGSKLSNLLKSLLKDNIKYYMPFITSLIDSAYPFEKNNLLSLYGIESSVEKIFKIPGHSGEMAAVFGLHGGFFLSNGAAALHVGTENLLIHADFLNVLAKIKDCNKNESGINKLIEYADNKGYKFLKIPYRSAFYYYVGYKISFDCHYANPAIKFIFYLERPSNNLPIQKTSEFVETWPGAAKLKAIMREYSALTLEVNESFLREKLNINNDLKFIEEILIRLMTYVFSNREFFESFFDIRRTTQKDPGVVIIHGNYKLGSVIKSGLYGGYSFLRNFIIIPCSKSLSIGEDCKKLKKFKGEFIRLVRKFDAMQKTLFLNGYNKKASDKDKFLFKLKVKYESSYNYPYFILELNPNIFLLAYENHDLMKEIIEILEALEIISNKHELMFIEKLIKYLPFL